MDETSISMWSNIKKKTWTNNTVYLPYQTKRGRNTTVIGAVGPRRRSILGIVRGAPHLQRTRQTILGEADRDGSVPGSKQGRDSR